MNVKERKERRRKASSGVLLWQWGALVGLFGR